jgi:hypothetical protein
MQCDATSDVILCCLLPAARCPLPAACCPLPAARCPLPAACCLLPAACCPLPAARCLPPAACCLLPDCVRSGANHQLRRRSSRVRLRWEVASRLVHRQPSRRLRATRTKRQGSMVVRIHSTAAPGLITAPELITAPGWSAGWHNHCPLAYHCPWLECWQVPVLYVGGVCFGRAACTRLVRPWMRSDAALHERSAPEPDLAELYDRLTSDIQPCHELDELQVPDPRRALLGLERCRLNLHRPKQLLLVRKRPRLAPFSHGN